MYANQNYPTKNELIALARRDSVQVFYIDAKRALAERQQAVKDILTDGTQFTSAGWWYWVCTPGCLPDSDAHGPFRSELRAYRDAFDYEFVGVES
jgi:hypothetical protein